MYLKSVGQYILLHYNSLETPQNICTKAITCLLKRILIFISSLSDLSLFAWLKTNKQMTLFIYSNYGVAVKQISPSLTHTRHN